MNTQWPEIYQYIKLEPLTSCTLPGALAIVSDFFNHSGDLFASTDKKITLEVLKELQKVFMNTSKDGLSIVAIDLRKNRKVIAVAFNKIRNGEPDKSFYEFYYEKFKCDFARQATLTQMEYATSKHNVTSQRCILEMVTICDKESRTDELTYIRLLDHTVEICNMLIAGIDIHIPVDINGDNKLTHDKCIPNLMTVVAFCNNAKNYMQSIGFVPWIEISMREKFLSPTISQMRECYIRKNRCLCFMSKLFYR